MSEKIITCITCPLGCLVTVTGEGDRIDSMEGAACKRGEAYARNEFSHPLRILTSIVKVEGADVPLVAVRSSAPLPKEKMFQCMDEIRRVVLQAPVRGNDVVIADVCGTGVDIVATGRAG